MGLFDTFFGKGKTSSEVKRKKVNWVPLESEGQLKEIQEKSFRRPQLIFKHSTSCGISRMVLGGFENNFPLGTEDADLYYLDLLRYRNVSNAVADVFGVVHQSPQLLAVVKGEVVLHDSHGGINNLDLRELPTDTTS
ncbi:MAG: bacillithiol system redox-active protein YtxJ [Flavobacteriaceae bacterium]